MRPNSCRSRLWDREGKTLPGILAGVYAGPVGLFEVDRHRTDIKQSEGGITHFVEERDIFDGCVIDSAPHADAGFPGSAEDFARDSFPRFRRVRNPQARGKSCVLRGGERTWHPRIAWENEAGGGIRINLRLHSGLESLNPVEGVVERLAHVPAQTVIDGQVGPDLISILPIYAKILGAGIQQLVAGLVEEVGCAQQVIGKVIASFAS